MHAFGTNNFVFTRFFTAEAMRWRSRGFLWNQKNVDMNNLYSIVKKAKFQGEIEKACKDLAARGFVTDDIPCKTSAHRRDRSSHAVPGSQRFKGLVEQGAKYARCKNGQWTVIGLATQHQPRAALAQLPRPPRAATPPRPQTLPQFQRQLSQPQSGCQPAPVQQQNALNEPPPCARPPCAQSTQPRGHFRAVSPMQPPVVVNQGARSSSTRQPPLVDHQGASSSGSNSGARGRSRGPYGVMPGAYDVMPDQPWKNYLQDYIERANGKAYRDC